MIEGIGPGSTIAGYRLERLLGRGGMGVVYAAHDSRLDRPVALKLIAPELAADSGLRRRFLDESRTAAGIEHPHVIPVYEAGEAEGALYLAMQLVEGDDLRSTLLQRGALPRDRAVPIIVQVASALEAAHARGLVHRDVKPSNILLAHGAPGDHAYLSDFGLCKPVESTTGITASGQVVGTVDYMAPEQLRGAHADGRADIYALGCVTFQCLTGSPPYTGGDVAVMLAHIQQPTPTLPGDPAVDEVLQRALAKAPEDRWPTVGEFASNLREASSSHPRSAAPTLPVTAPPPPPAAPRPRRRIWALVAAVGALAAAAVAVVLVWEAGRPPAPRAPLRIQSEMALGSGRTVLAGGRAGLFVIRRSTGGGGTVNRVDERSGRLMPGAHVNPTPVGVGVGGSSAWVLSFDSTQAGSAALLHVSGAGVSPTQSLRGQPGCVNYVRLICNPVVGGGSIWVPVGTTIYRVDGSGEVIQRSYPLGARAGQAIYTHGALWALAGRELIRIDGSSGVQTTRPLDGLDPGLDPVQLTLAGSQLWIVCFSGSNPEADALARVPIADPGYHVAAVIRYPRLSAAAGTDTSLWTTSSADTPEIRRLDPDTGTPLGAPLALPTPVTWAVAAGRDVWLVGFRSDSRARTLLHLVPAGGG